MTATRRPRTDDDRAELARLRQVARDANARKDDLLGQLASLQKTLVVLQEHASAYARELRATTDKIRDLEAETIDDSLDDSDPRLVEARIAEPDDVVDPLRRRVGDVVIDRAEEQEWRVEAIRHKMHPYDPEPVDYLVTRLGSPTHAPRWMNAARFQHN